MQNTVRYPHLLKAAIFKGLTDAQKEQFLDECSIQIFCEEKDVLVQGHMSEGLYIVAHGALEISRGATERERITLFLINQGSTVGELEAISNIPSIANVTARAGTTLLLCERSKLVKWMTQESFLGPWMGDFAKRLALQNENRVLERSQPIEVRVGRYLWQFADKRGVFDRSQGLLAEAVGCSRQTVNVVIREFKENGLVERRSQGVQIIDLKQFEELFG